MLLAAEVAVHQRLVLALGDDPLDQGVARASSISGRCCGVGVALDAVAAGCSRRPAATSRPISPPAAPSSSAIGQVERQHALAEHALADRDRLVEVGARRGRAW